MHFNSWIFYCSYFPQNFWTSLLFQYLYRYTVITDILFENMFYKLTTRIECNRYYLVLLSSQMQSNQQVDQPVLKIAPSIALIQHVSRPACGPIGFINPTH